MKTKSLRPSPSIESISSSSSIPMWDSSDPDRNPPPIPIAPERFNIQQHQMSSSSSPRSSKTYKSTPFRNLHSLISNGSSSNNSSHISSSAHDSEKIQFLVNAVKGMQCSILTLEASINTVTSEFVGLMHRSKDNGSALLTLSKKIENVSELVQSSGSDCEITSPIKSSVALNIENSKELVNKITNQIIFHNQRVFDALTVQSEILQELMRLCDKEKNINIMKELLDDSLISYQNSENIFNTESQSILYNNLNEIINPLLQNILLIDSKIVTHDSMTCELNSFLSSQSDIFSSKFNTFIEKEKEILAEIGAQLLNSYDSKFATASSSINNNLKSFDEKIVLELKSSVNLLSQTKDDILNTLQHYMSNQSNTLLNQVQSEFNSYSKIQTENQQVITAINKTLHNFDEKIASIDSSLYLHLNNKSNDNTSKLLENFSSIEDEIKLVKTALNDIKNRFFDKINHDNEDNLNSKILEKKLVEKEISDLKNEVSQLYEKKTNLSSQLQCVDAILQQRKKEYLELEERAEKLEERVTNNILEKSKAILNSQLESILTPANIPKRNITSNSDRLSGIGIGNNKMRSVSTVDAGQHRYLSMSRQDYNINNNISDMKKFSTIKSEPANKAKWGTSHNLENIFPHDKENDDPVNLYVPKRNKNRIMNDVHIPNTTNTSSLSFITDSSSSSPPSSNPSGL